MKTVLKSKKNLQTLRLMLALLVWGTLIVPFIQPQVVEAKDKGSSASVEEALASVPAYTGAPAYEVNGGVPFFTDDELTTTSFEKYSSKDKKGRCRVAYACVGKETMPTEPRGNIGKIKPSGWHTVKYDGIDGNYLYNRCHLIGYQLTGENANSKNLITGTRYLNTVGMLPFEEEVADYVERTGNHVQYRVTPYFGDSNKLAYGVLMEAESVEDGGKGVEFNVFCYNVQPGITIAYEDGSSSGPEFTGSKSSRSEKSQKVSTSSTSNEVAREQAVTQEQVVAPEPQVAPEQEVQTTPQAEVQEVAPQAASEDMVWKTKSGNAYHKTNHCGNTNPANCTQISLDQASKMGLHACGNCYR